MQELFTFRFPFMFLVPSKHHSPQHNEQDVSSSFNVAIYLAASKLAPDLCTLHGPIFLRWKGITPSLLKNIAFQNWRHRFSMCTKLPVVKVYEWRFSMSRQCKKFYSTTCYIGSKQKNWHGVIHSNHVVSRLHWVARDSGGWFVVQDEPWLFCQITVNLLSWALAAVPFTHNYAKFDIGCLGLMAHRFMRDFLMLTWPANVLFVFQLYFCLL